MELNNYNYEIKRICQRMQHVDALNRKQKLELEPNPNLSSNVNINVINISVGDWLLAAQAFDKKCETIKLC